LNFYRKTTPEKEVVFSIAISVKHYFMRGIFASWGKCRNERTERREAKWREAMTALA
jgi:hypothetical protein